MKKAEELLAICRELSEDAEFVSGEDIEKLAELIIKSNRIFIAGAGRSGFAARAFANRLMHLGLTVFFVGETTTPSKQANDLLIIGSGSGETGSLVTMANKASGQNASVATITIYPQATIGALSKVTVKLPGSTNKSDIDSGKVSIQPMGSSFEQLSLLVYDSLIMILMKKLNKTGDEMFKNHANLE